MYINLKDIIKNDDIKNISMYNGYFDVNEYIENILFDDLEKDDKDIEFDIEIIKKELSKAIKDVLLPSYIDDVLKRYNLELKSTLYFTPRFYNYSDDRLDIEIIDKSPDDIIPENIKEKMKQFKNDAPESCDGYISFIDKNEYKRDSIEFIYAIFEIEGLSNDISNNVNDFIEVGENIIYNNYRIIDK